jgi:hypothetical protein
MLANRAGTHQAHLSLQYVDQLGQLVQTQLAQDLSHPGNATISLHRPLGSIKTLGVIDHGPQLIKPKRNLVLPQPFLDKKYRPFAFQLDGQGGDQEKNHCQGKKEQDHEQVNRPFQPAGCGGKENFLLGINQEPKIVKIIDGIFEGQELIKIVGIDDIPFAKFDSDQIVNNLLEDLGMNRVNNQVGIIIFNKVKKIRQSGIVTMPMPMADYSVIL